MTLPGYRETPRLGELRGAEQSVDVVWRLVVIVDKRVLDVDLGFEHAAKYQLFNSSSRSLPLDDSIQATAMEISDR